jgi:disulfide bond formation protein DsbB
MTITDLNSFLALGTLVLEIVGVVLLAIYFFPSLIPGSDDVKALVTKWGMLAGLTLILTTALANFYYESFGFEPCPLCWWQRIFLYPQAVLFAFALRKTDYAKAAIDFSLVFSVFGAGVALYQHALQMLPGSGLPCPAVGASCATRILFEYGHITYPWMAFVLFALLFVVMLFVRGRYA